MNQLKEYRRFVRQVAPSGYKKELDRTCLGLLGWVIVAILAARYMGVDVDPLYQVPSILCVLLILATYLPHPALLLAIWGLASVVWSYLKTGDLAGYGVLILGLSCFFTAHKLWKAFKKFRETGACVLPEKNDIILGPAQPVGQETFLVQEPCPECGARELKVIGTKYSRFALRFSNHSADWRLSCPCCGYGAAVSSRRAKRLSLDNGAFVQYRRAEFVDWWLAAALVSLGAVIVGLVLTVFLSLSGRAVYARDVRSAQLPANRQFIGEELSIVDFFAITAPEDWRGGWFNRDPVEAIYMIASWEQGETTYLLPVKILPTKDIFDDCWSFAADPEAGALIRDIHGFIDHLDGQDLEKFYQEAAQDWRNTHPNTEAIHNMVIYWDGDTTPSDDDDILAAMRLVAAAGTALTAVFLWLDAYSNSAKRAERVQARRDAR